MISRIFEYKSSNTVYIFALLGTMALLSCKTSHSAIDSSNLPRSTDTEMPEKKVGEQVVNTSFDHPNGPYTREKAITDFFQIPHFGRHGEIIDQQLVTFFPANQYGNSRTGAFFRVELPPSDEYFLSYRFKFSENFDLTGKGGKLPGLAGGDANTGGVKPNGSGWSARFMFRNHGKAVVYLYHMDQRGVFGTDIDLNYSFETDRWYIITQRVKVNNGQESNGELQVWIDGNEKVFLNNIRFRIDNLAPVDKFWFATFLGGNDMSWSISEDSNIVFDFVKIGTSYSSVNH